ncbi:hypothetical protein [Nocardioides perillae]|uniref:Di/tricarboxylate transporter n=1 Tax=Nocardioides perillae TaxID=1119534 RepID=A0A7Y9ULL7_9ACTN|nr:hypothetical protein [Nocardioides perillae]NYG56608.1 di/tricarboxylate transporter [Nocardioides perillae]
MSEPGKPSVRPLGGLAVGLSLVALMLAPTYFSSPFAYISAALAVFLGVAARTDLPSRRLGTIAVAVAAVSIVVATTTLVLVGSGWDA